ncbi:PfkB family carbohydrate kinase [Klebsiella spallanzanii]|uniref:Fructosamine kinase FrlD n=1 Tax=Klebsiella spallanzanii TaxID=2587528 RepID=A0A564LHV9_9ENTR|nr:PfkB family carbohydrate kinase [Klebsiella spallanzanii]VUS81167.1 Fructosamine kinase FrlD [Klebsiella spallanzanii]
MPHTNPSCLLACEILWDCVEDSPPLQGGATLNVAYHLKKLGCRIVPVSSVGSDRLGSQSLSIIKNEWCCDISEIEVLKDVGTGVVDVKIDAAGDATYDIHNPAAWDYIRISHSAKNLTCSAFVYGSVALRSAYNQRSFADFLQIYQGLKCFDVNLREGQNDIQIVGKFLQHADFIKLNESELDQVADHFHIVGENIEERIFALTGIIGHKIICITRGDKSPVLYWKGNIYHGQAVRVDVKNTIGAGDAFFAAMINALINPDFDPVAALYKSSILGSWVATKEGAQPKYDSDITDKFFNHQAVL